MNLSSGVKLLKLVHLVNNSGRLLSEKDLYFQVSSLRCLVHVSVMLFCSLQTLVFRYLPFFFLKKVILASTA